MADLIYDGPELWPPQPPAPAKPAARPLPDVLNADAVEPLMACPKCNGAGHALHKGFKTPSRRFPSRWDTCHHCDGAGWFHAPDPRALLLAVKGRKPRSLRSKRPDDARAYYVWRLARFHGGRDVCLPIGAEMEVGADPYRPLLDAMAVQVARHCFGSGNVGRARWQQALTGSHCFSDVPADLSGMPAYDADKPESELLETVCGTEATLEGQDWFTPWETVSTGADEDEALEWFADLFYLEDLE